MKKIILSVFILGSFGAYTLWQSQNGSPMAYVSSQSVALTEVNPQVAVSLLDPSSTTSTPASVPGQKSSAKSSKKNEPKTVPPVQTAPVPPTPAPVPALASQNTGEYNNGTYVGSVANAYYGNVQVEAIITNGQISDVQFLNYPQDRNTSRRINSQAMPELTQEAIQAQSANVDGVSGASDTSAAFEQSLASALNQAVRT